MTEVIEMTGADRQRIITMLQEAESEGETIRARFLAEAKRAETHYYASKFEQYAEDLAEALKGIRSDLTELSEALDSTSDESKTS